MSNELAISSTQKGDRIALLQDKKLVEYQVDQHENRFTVGDIYLGLVKKVSPGLNAAFVDVGHDKDAFLHYLDLGPQILSLTKYLKQAQQQKSGVPDLGQLAREPDIDKLGKINQVLSRGQHVLVQVIKEPISTKGPRLACEISLAGRYVVLVPFSDAINVSKKITSKTERQRLQRLVDSIRPEGFGVIIRTVAEGCEVAELDRDIRNLADKWASGMAKLATAKPRDLIVGEVGRASTILRDLLNESFDSITVDNRDMYEKIRLYIRSIAPDKESILRLHNGNKAKLFEANGIEKQLKSLFGKTVSLPSGGYLVIEHTEALHVIDVNSGNSGNKATANSQEDTALKVNLEAAAEIARQLRLRDMGGIIVVDFIDQRKAENRKLIYQAMKTEMKADRSRSTVLPLSKFGLLQITRQRVRPEMNIKTVENCPTCGGTGKIAASILIADQIEQHLEFILTKQNERSVTLVLHPYLEAYFSKGLFSRRFRWFWQYKVWVRLVGDTALPLPEYRFTNRRGEQIELNA